MTFPEILRDTVFSADFEVGSPENSRGYNHDLQRIVFILRHVWATWEKVIYIMLLRKVTHFPFILNTFLDTLVTIQNVGLYILQRSRKYDQN